MKLRMKFTKTGPLMYVGHLDLLRYFQKTFRRANVDIAYTQGFRPHQVLSFAAPLGIGITSEGEYLDAEFNSVEPREIMLDKINAATGTPYISVTEIVRLKEGAKKAMAAVGGADYSVTPLETMSKEAWSILLNSVDLFISRNNIIINKKTKKSEQEINIRPFIHRINVEDNRLVMRLTAGSKDNLKPELVMESLCRLFFASWILFSVVSDLAANSPSMLPAYRAELPTMSKAFCRPSVFWANLPIAADASSPK